MLSIVIAGLDTRNCVKQSKLTIFSLEPQGHVIDHAQIWGKNITWIENNFAPLITIIPGGVSK